MLRVLFAALAGGIVLRLWAAISATVLPWPIVVVGLVQSPTLAAVSPAGARSAAVPTGLSDELLLSPPLNAQGTPPLPVRSYYRSTGQRVSSYESVHSIVADLGVALLAAVAALLIPANTPWPRQAGLVLLGASVAALLGNLSHAARLDWTAEYVVVQSIDHFISLVLVAAVVIVIVRLSPPRKKQQPSTPLSIDGR